jgi:hypothetical protein
VGDIVGKLVEAFGKEQEVHGIFGGGQEPLLQVNAERHSHHFIDMFRRKARDTIHLRDQGPRPRTKDVAPRTKDEDEDKDKGKGKDNDKGKGEGKDNDQGKGEGKDKD